MSDIFLQYPTYLCLLDTISNPRQIIWHIEHLTLSQPVCQCGNNVSWHPDKREYRSYCSKSCTAKYTVDLKKKNNIDKFGSSWHTQTSEWKQKVKETSIEKFGVDHYSKSDQYKQQVAETNLEKFGTTSPAKNPDILKKMQDTLSNRYNCKNPMHIDGVSQKIKNTKILNHNDPTYNNGAKRKQTNLKKYGVEHPLQNSKVQSAAILTKKTNYYEPGVLLKLNDPTWLKLQFESGLTVGEIATILGVSSSNLCKYFNKYNININIGRNTSSIEREITEFLTLISVDNIILNDRSILNKKELDIVLPDYKLAIEVNGIYWHTEKQGKTKYYHYNKSHECQEKGFQLLHITDVSWENKKDIWKSVIKSKLNLNQRIYARKCTLKEIDTATAREFTDKNHLAGYVGGHKKVGLFYNGTLVQVAILGKPRFTKKYKYELIRLSSLAGLTVVGGASKLLSTVDGSIVSYADFSYSSGNLYKKLGFIQQNQTSINYYYVKNNVIESRNKYQKHKLAKLLNIFDPALSEFENMKNNGYDRYWDAGQLTFVKI